jgi:hypothetical protein
MIRTPPPGWASVWLTAVLAGIIGYGVTLVVAGGRVDRAVFAPLGFGAPAGLAASDGHDHLLLVMAVLGAVLAGWGTTLLVVTRGPLRRGEPWAWTAISSGLAVWFLLDSVASLVLGSWAHALFNLGFVVVLAPPLLVLRQGPGAQSMRRLRTRAD